MLEIEGRKRYIALCAELALGEANYRVRYCCIMSSSISCCNPLQHARYYIPVPPNLTFRIPSTTVTPKTDYFPNNCQFVFVTQTKRFLQSVY